MAAKLESAIALSSGRQRGKALTTIGARRGSRKRRLCGLLAWSTDPDTLIAGVDVDEVPPRIKSRTASTQQTSHLRELQIRYTDHADIRRASDDVSRVERGTFGALVRVCSSIARMDPQWCMYANAR